MARRFPPSTCPALAVANFKQHLTKKGGLGRPFYALSHLLDATAIAALSAAWLIPNHYPPWSSFYSEAAGFIALFALAVRFHSRLLRRSAPRITWVVWVIAAVPIAQWSTGILSYSSDAVLAALYVSAFAGAIVVGCADDEGGRLLLNVSTALLIGSFASSLIALLQVFDFASMGIWLVEVPPGGQPVANLGHWNLLATLIGLGAVALVVLYEAGKLTTTVSIAIAVVLILGLGVTRSRTALVYGPIVFLALGWAKRKGIRLRTHLLVVAIATIAYWLIALSMAHFTRAMHLEVNVFLETRGVVESPRWQMWKMLVRAVSLSPWWGYGWLQVGAAELAVVNFYPPINELWLQAHNIFLELVIWNGLPLGLLLGGALIVWFYDRWRRISSRNAAFGMLSVTILLVHSLVEFPYHYAYFLIPLGLWIGIVESSLVTRPLVAARLNVVPLVILAALAIAVAWDYFRIEEEFRLVRFENLHVGVQSTTAVPVEAPFLSSLTAFLQFSRTEPKAPLSQDEVRRFERSAVRYPYPASLAKTARALALNGRPKEAMERFVNIRQMYGQGTYMKLRVELRDLARQTGSQSLMTFEQTLPD